VLALQHKGRTTSSRYGNGGRGGAIDSGHVYCSYLNMLEVLTSSDIKIVPIKGNWIIK
jgi:hypothetical protein